MPISKTVPVPGLGISAAWWRIMEVRDVRQAEPSFPGAVGNIFVHLAGYASEEADAAGSSPLTVESFRIRYGSKIPDPLPNSLVNPLVIREDDFTTAQVEEVLSSLPMFNSV